MPPKRKNSSSRRSSGSTRVGSGKSRHSLQFEKSPEVVEKSRIPISDDPLTAILLTPDKPCKPQLHLVIICTDSSVDVQSMAHLLHFQMRLSLERKGGPMGQEQLAEEPSGNVSLSCPYYKLPAISGDVAGRELNLAKQFMTELERSKSAASGHFPLEEVKEEKVNEEDATRSGGGKGSKGKGAGSGSGKGHPSNGNSGVASTAHLSNASSSRQKKQSLTAFPSSNHADEVPHSEVGAMTEEESCRLRASWSQKYDWLSLPCNSVATMDGKTRILFIYELIDQEEVLKMMPEDSSGSATAAERKLRESLWATVHAAIPVDTSLNEIAVVWAVPDVRLLRALKEVPRATREERGEEGKDAVKENGSTMVESFPFQEDDAQRHLHVRLIVYSNDAAFIDPTVSAPNIPADKSRSGVPSRFPSAKKTSSRKGNLSGDSATSRASATRGGKNSKGGAQKNAGGVSSEATSESINYFERGVAVDDLLFQCGSFADFIDKQVLIQKQKAAAQKALEQGKPPQSDCHPRYLSMQLPEEVTHESRLATSMNSDSFPSPLEAQLNKPHVLSLSFPRFQAVGTPAGRQGSRGSTGFASSKGAGSNAAPTPPPEGATPSGGGGTSANATTGGSSSPPAGPTAGGQLSMSYLPPDTIWGVVRVNQAAASVFTTVNTSTGKYSSGVGSNSGSSASGGGSSAGAFEEEWVQNWRRKAVPAVYEVASMVSLYNSWCSEKHSVTLPMLFREREFYRLSPGLVQDKRDMFFPHQMTRKDTKIFMLGRSEEEWQAKNGPCLESGLQIYEREKLLNGVFTPFTGVMALISQVMTNLARLQPLRLVQLADSSTLPPILAEVVAHQQCGSSSSFRRENTATHPLPMTLGDNRGTASVKGMGRREDLCDGRVDHHANRLAAEREEGQADAKKSKARRGSGAGVRRKYSSAGKRASADKDAEAARARASIDEISASSDHSNGKDGTSTPVTAAAWVLPGDYCHYSRKAAAVCPAVSADDVDALVLKCVQKGLGKFCSSIGAASSSASPRESGANRSVRGEEASETESRTENASFPFATKSLAQHTKEKTETGSKGRFLGSLLQQMDASHNRIGGFRTYTCFVQHLNLFSYLAALRDAQYSAHRLLSSVVSRRRRSRHTPQTLAVGIDSGHTEEARTPDGYKSALGKDAIRSLSLDPSVASVISCFAEDPPPRPVHPSAFWHQGPQDFMAHLTQPLTCKEEQTKLSIERYLTARERAHIIQSSLLVELARSSGFLPADTSRLLEEASLVVEEVVSFPTALHRMIRFPLHFGDHIASIYSFASPELLLHPSYLLSFEDDFQDEKESPPSVELPQDGMSGVKKCKEIEQKKKGEWSKVSHSSNTAMSFTHAVNVYPPRRSLQYWVCGIPIPPCRRKNLVWAFSVSGTLSIEQYAAWKRWEHHIHEPPVSVKDESRVGDGPVSVTVQEPQLPSHSGSVTFASPPAGYTEEKFTGEHMESAGMPGIGKERNGKHSKLATTFLETLLRKVLGYSCTHTSQSPPHFHTVGKGGHAAEDGKKRSSFTRPELSGPHGSGTAADGKGGPSTHPASLHSTARSESVTDATATYSSALPGEAKSGTSGGAKLSACTAKSIFDFGKDLYLATEGHQILYPYCDAVVEVITTNYSRQCRYLTTHELTATLHYNIPQPSSVASAFCRTGGNRFPSAMGLPPRGAASLALDGTRCRPSMDEWCEAWVQALKKSTSLDETSYLSVRFEDGLTVTIANRAKPLVLGSHANGQSRKTVSQASEVSDRIPPPKSAVDTDSMVSVPSKSPEQGKRSSGRRSSEKKLLREKRSSSRRRSSVFMAGSTNNFSTEAEKPQGTDYAELFAAARRQPVLCPPIAPNGDIRLWVARESMPSSVESSHSETDDNLLHCSSYPRGRNGSVHSLIASPGGAGTASGSAMLGRASISLAGPAAAGASGGGMMQDDRIPHRASLNMGGNVSALTTDTSTEAEEDRNTVDGAVDASKGASASDAKVLRVEPLDVTIASTNFVFHSREREGIIWFSFLFSTLRPGGDPHLCHLETIWAVRSNIGAYSILQPSLEREVHRAVIESTGVVVRYFESGATQALFPDGTTSFQCREAGIEPVLVPVPSPSYPSPVHGGGETLPSTGKASEMGDTPRTQKERMASPSFLHSEFPASSLGGERVCETFFLSSGGMYVRSVYHNPFHDLPDSPFVGSPTSGSDEGIGENLTISFTRLSHYPQTPLLVQYDPTYHCHTITREDGVLVVYYYYFDGKEELHTTEETVDAHERKKNPNPPTHASSIPSRSPSYLAPPFRSPLPFSSSAPHHPSSVHRSVSLASTNAADSLPRAVRQLEAKLHQDRLWDGNLEAAYTKDPHAPPSHRYPFPVSHPFPSGGGGSGLGIRLEEMPEVYARVTLHADGTTISTFGELAQRMVRQHRPREAEEVPPIPPFSATKCTSSSDGVHTGKTSAKKKPAGAGEMWSTPADIDMDIPVVVDSSVAPSVSSLLHDMWMVQATCHGKVKWCVESIRTPRIFVVSMEERLKQMRNMVQDWHLTQDGRAASVREIDRLQAWGGGRNPYTAFYLVFGDGSVLKRHIFSRPTRGTVVPFLETIFSRPTDTVLRMIHDNGMVIVERGEDVQRNLHNAAAAAIGEGFAVFDLALGGFRLVDYLSHVTEVQNLYSPFGVTSSLTPVPWEVLLQHLVHETYSSHRLPTAQTARLLALKEVEEAKDRRLRAANLCPSLSHRMQELAEEFVISHGLLKPDVLHTLEKASLVSKGLQKSDLRKAAFESQVGVGNEVSTMMGRIAPMFFCRRANNEMVQLMSAKAMEREVEGETTRSNTSNYKDPMYLLRSVAVGEPSIEQLSLFRVQYQLDSSLKPIQNSLTLPDAPFSPASIGTENAIGNTLRSNQFLEKNNLHSIRTIPVPGGSLLHTIQCQRKLSSFHNGLSKAAHYQHEDGGVYDRTIADVSLFSGSFSRWHPRECQPPRNFLQPPVRKPFSSKSNRKKIEVLEVNDVMKEEKLRPTVKTFPSALAHKGVRTFLQFQPTAPLTANTVLHIELERNVQISDLSKYHHLVENTFQKIPAEAVKEQDRLQQLYFAMKNSQKKH